jgi:stearoyl-CoA desaturase (Delta-9 desaturase)
MADELTVDYVGTEPFLGGGSPPRSFEGGVRVAVTAVIVAVPFGGLALAVWLAWGHGLNLTDILLAAAFYLVTGLGVTIGFHRLLTHRSFTAAPALRVVLAIAGSMSFEGDVIGWVATHRRHHAFAGRPGDPAMRAVSAAFPAWCAVSLGLPFAAGWAIGGIWHAALAALLWAGLVRVALATVFTGAGCTGNSCSCHSACEILAAAPRIPGPGCRRQEVAGYAPAAPEDRLVRRAQWLRAQ